MLNKQLFSVLLLIFISNITHSHSEEVDKLSQDNTNKNNTIKNKIPRAKHQPQIKGNSEESICGDNLVSETDERSEKSRLEEMKWPPEKPSLEFNE